MKVFLGKKISLIAFLLVFFLSCGGSFLAPNGPWNPEDPDYQGADDPDFDAENAQKAPTVLAAEALSWDSVKLTWKDESNTESGYTVERKVQGATEWIEAGSTTADAEDFTDTGLAGRTTYTYRVCAFSDIGTSPWTEEVTVVTDPPPGAPEAPTGLTVTAASSEAIDLAWTDNADNETSYKVERSIDGTNFNLLTILASDAESWQDTGLPYNTLYYYRVWASNTDGDSAYSNTASDTTLNVPPAGPTDLSTEGGYSTKITLSWTDNADNEDGFRVERKIGAGGIYEVLETVASGTGTGTTIEYNDEGLQPSTAYFYTVYAYNEVGESSSDEVSRTTLAKWSKEDILSGYNTLSGRRGFDLALDDDDPHVSFYDEDNLNLCHAWHNGSSWSYETLDGAASDTGKWSSIAIDGSDNIHVSCYDETGSGVSYMTYDGFSWSTPAIIVSGGQGETSVSTDSSGNPWVFFGEGTSDDVLASHYNGTTWNNTTVETTGDVGWWGVSSVVDSSDVPHVCYVDGQGSSAGRLHYARWNGSAWDIAIVDSGTDNQFSDILVDGSDHPHIMYGDNRLLHAWHDGSSWNTEVADAGVNPGPISSAVDDAGNIHVVFGSGDDLYYALYDGSSWTTELVDASISVDSYSFSVQCAVSGNGIVHICCYDYVHTVYYYVMNP